LNGNDLHTFTNAIEDVLFRCVAKREVNPIYKQDEVQIHCYDEYEAHVDKDGIVSDQKARVRMFCLAFLTGTPFLEIGLNDRRRQGKVRSIKFKDYGQYFFGMEGGGRLFNNFFLNR
jgi:stonin-1/2